MRRYLLARNRELEGALLVNIGRGRERPRWSIALSALMALHPQWFLDPDTFQRGLDDLREENEQLRVRVTRLERIVEMQSEVIGRLRKVNELAPRRTVV